MKYKVGSRTVKVRFEDAEPVSGVSTGLRPVTIVPVTMEARIDGTGRIQRISLMGPKIRLGAVGTAYFECLVSHPSHADDAAYPLAPQWLVDILDEVAA